MKRMYYVCVLLFFSLNLLGQAKKPELMVVPSLPWCNEKGYVFERTTELGSETFPDYKKALAQDKDLMNVISKIGILMADKGFPLKDLSTSIKNMEMMNARNAMTLSKNSGAVLTETALDVLKRTAKCDIILEVDWSVNVLGPKKSVTYNLRGIDACTNMQVAGAQGTGQPSFSAEIPVLVEEAILVNMDNFTSQLQAHFDNLFENGREVSIDINVFDTEAGIDLETEYGENELIDVIEEWLEKHCVKGRFSKAEGSENFAMFNQVRIPMINENGKAIDTEDFVKELRKMLRKPPYNLVCKVIPHGLGRCQLIIGDK
ncbi:DUF6175 family protein [uncultured Bacteroides sp.]|jgi:hypothetical protein|uniref:DUF6175 family protein n=2 Tax=Bacteroides TaxID=816 RepID=UPI0025828C7A|nr:DUF6175 family protein [uncultured Bacteroides sp.]